MTSPLRQMTEAAGRMATGDYAVRVTDTSSDEVGELARAFNTMARDLDTVDRQRRELVANVSHELRTPLAGLCAVLENVVDGVAPDDPAVAPAALDQAERISRLVEDLLDLARVDAGQAPLEPQPVALASAARRRRRRGARARARRWTTTSASSRSTSWCGPTPRGCTSSWPTCSTTRRATARPAARCW